LADFFQLPQREIEAALLALEAEGFVLRGKFHPGATGVEWCERRLLARIHRRTLHRLRAEIQPVTLAEFLRFLLVWQRVPNEQRGEGCGGVEAVLELLDGFEVPAGAWEPEVLAPRVKDYAPEWLDQLCFMGQIGWGRLTPPLNSKARAFTPLRSSPVSLFLRENLPPWRALASAPPVSEFSPDTEIVRGALERGGAMFFAEFVRSCGLLPSRVEQALGELAAQGWVTADSFEGLRALLVPQEKRAPFADVSRKRRHKTVTSIQSAGRWSLLRGSGAAQENSSALEPEVKALQPGPMVRRRGLTLEKEEAIEAFARVLLRRYGVVFRRLLERESFRVSWFDLGCVYRRLEARGEIRGGHFVGGVSGEQFALPEAIGLLRSVRKTANRDELITLSAVDPLNLVGILTPGPRITAIATNRVLLHDGVPIAALEAGQIRKLHEQSEVSDRVIEQALKIGKLPAALRPYYG
jgi:ATP-dependent Lhr-like helicase